MLKHTTSLLASERSERDTIRGNSIEISLYLASERSERDTYRGNTIENRGCLFIYLYIWTYVCHRVFVLVMWSTPFQIALNRILWFIDQYPYHPFEFFCGCSFSIRVSGGGKSMRSLSWL